MPPPKPPGYVFKPLTISPKNETSSDDEGEGDDNQQQQHMIDQELLHKPVAKDYVKANRNVKQSVVYAQNM